MQTYTHIISELFRFWSFKRCHLKYKYFELLVNHINKTDSIYSLKAVQCCFVDEVAVLLSVNLVIIMHTVTVPLISKSHKVWKSKQFFANSSLGSTYKTSQSPIFNQNLNSDIFVSMILTKSYYRNCMTA